MKADRKRPTPLRLMVMPRDGNPYQSLLYRAMARCNVRVRYVGELTPSRTANLLLLPAEVIVLRLTGYKALHLHWVFPFAVPGRSRHRLLGLASQALFGSFLWSLRLSGTRLVWTAHNVMPHSPVMWDDLAGRRWLVRQADLVIVHSQSTLDELRALGLEPARPVILPHGPFDPVRPASDVGPVLGRPTEAHERLILFVGKVETYKGVEDLVHTFTSAPPRGTRLVVAGECTDQDLQQRLSDLAFGFESIVHLYLHRLSDAQLSAALERADVLALPFRRITTSGSAIQGLGAGVPLIIPDLPALADLPDEAVFRYETQGGLSRALERAATTPRDVLDAMGEEGRRFIQSRSWDAIAAETADAIRILVGGRRASADPAWSPPRTRAAR